MGHHTCCNRQKVKRGLWSPEEDEKLINYISTYGHGCWSSVPRLAGLQRCGKSCRLRWINYLRPDLKRGSFSHQEAAVIIELHRVLGNKWAQIAKHLPGRTDNEVKNFWNSSIKKKIMSTTTHQNHPNFSPNILANSSGSSSSETPYLMNPNENFIPNPQMDQIPIIPNPPTTFDLIESRFNEMMANLAPISLPNVSFPILNYLPSSPFPCNINPQNIPQIHHQIIKQDNNFIFGLDAPNPLILMNPNLENIQTHDEPYYDNNNQDSSSTINYQISKGNEIVFAPYSSTTQDIYPFLDEIAENLPAPPSPMSYIESLVAALESPAGPATAASGDSSSSASPPPPPPPAGASSSISPLPCSSSISFLDDPSFVSIWGGPQP